MFRKRCPGARIQPTPGLTLAEPELQMIPNERRVAEAGWTRQQVASISRALGTGLYVGDFFNGQRRLNVFLRSTDWGSPEELASIPLFTPSAGVQQVGELVEIKRTAGPSSIRRVDRKRTITFQVTPPDNLSLEEAIQKNKNRSRTGNFGSTVRKWWGGLSRQCRSTYRSFGKHESKLYSGLSHFCTF